MIVSSYDHGGDREKVNESQSADQYSARAGVQAQPALTLEERWARGGVVELVTIVTKLCVLLQISLIHLYKTYRMRCLSFM